ncbi:cytidine deaminase [Paraglaciecola sp.]|uniref:cytidine deaminase n=1 Tax=Paraglaciecola sp. TaxID=1920173 RepID=UPI003EF66BEF
MRNDSVNDKKQLLALAQQVQRHAHAPYSNFRVGAAIIDENAQYHGSCNVENAAYPLGQCAEAGAISAMVSAGNKHIKQILILSPNEEYCPPCGGCRQKIAEFANDQTQVHLAKSNGEIKTLLISELLPLAFNLDTP